MTRLEPVHASTERDHDRDELRDQFRGPWLNTDDAATYLRYTGKHPLRSVYKFIARHNIVTRHDGRRLLLTKADVDRALDLGRRRG